jgi:amino acid adenylation domain-containing protein/FkbM family methyltransferase
MKNAAEKLASLSPAELSRLAKGRKDRAAGTISRRARAEAEPASSAQQRIWLADRLTPNTSQYHVPLFVDLEGAVEPSIVEKSLAKLIERHESLRTVFVERDGEPFQVVHAPYEPTLELMDLSALDASQAEKVWLEKAQHVTRQPFQLDRGPLLRACLCRLDDVRSRLFLVMHHIISDGWSAGIIAAELRELTARGGADQGLPDLAIQYGDFAAWQRESLHSGKFNPQLEYWKAKLAGLPASPLPVSEPPSQKQAPRAGVKTFRIPAEIGDQVIGVGAQEHATPFMTLLAAFKVLLFRHTGQSDVVVGAPVAGRNDPDLEKLVGCFVNPLVLRTDLSGDPQFGELVRRVRETTLEAYSNQDIPFERLIETMQPERGSGQTPLFQVAFSLQNLPMFGAASEVDTGITLDQPKFALFLSLTPTQSGLAGVWEYDRNVIGDGDVESFTERFLILLEDIASRPVRISGLQILDPSDLAAANAAPVRRAAPQHRRIDEVIGEHVNRDRNRVAVRTGDRTLSYGELWTGSENVATRIREAGITAQSLVGVLIERSPEAVIAVLGILRAGCAYVPVDPHYPFERVILMLEPLAGVVTTASCEHAHIARLNVPTILLDEEANAPSEEPQAGTGAPSEAAAYAIYTSGSTGRPKLASVSQAGLINLLDWYIREFSLTEADRVLVVTSLSFDLTQKNMLAPLLIGAEVQMLRPGPFDPLEVARFVRAHRSTLINCTPSAIYAIADLGGQALENLESLRFVVLGGEPIMTRRLLPFLRSRYFRSEFANTYGPTECTDVVSCHRVEGLERYLDRRVPIGRPIPNVRLFVLDENLAHMPVGMEGELYIGGAAVGLGYVGDRTLCARKFVPDPFSDEPGRLLYRTGDRAKRLTDGSFDFLGRRDEQLKIRGFRVEPGEIEGTLLRHDAVREAAVGSFSINGGEPRLAAFVVPQNDVGAPLLEFQEMVRAGRLEHESLYELPNGLLIAHRNRSETDFLYRELFEEEGYFKHGIELPATPIIFDVGANIGLFGLAVAMSRPAARLFAFEPIPPIFQTLAANDRAYGLGMRLFDFGLAARPGSAEFRHYPYASILSGRYADAAEEREAVMSFLLTERDAGRAGDLTDLDLQDVLDQRLASEVFTCELKRLSDVMRAEGVSHIDLLKIDVEKSERDVFAGVDAEHWRCIRQVVAEVHDVDDNLAWVVGLLERHGFDVAVDQDTSIAAAGMHNVYAKRADAPTLSCDQVVAAPRWAGPEKIKRTLRAHLAAHLPEPFVPGHFVFMSRLPVTPSGKVDRSALPKLAIDGLYRRAQYTPPRTDLERALAGIWSGVLGLPRIGVHDNFFDLGGHSLLATQVVARVRRSYDIDLALRTFFEHATIEGLSRAVVAAIIEKENAPEAVLAEETA